MLYRFLGVVGSTPPTSFISGSVLFYPTLGALLVTAAYCRWKRVAGPRAFLVLCLVLYASLVLEITLFPVPISFAEIAAARTGPFFSPPDLNLVPLRSILSSSRGMGDPGFSAFLRNWLGNALLFVPLGVVAPLLWPRFRGVRNAVLLLLAASVAIESAQYLGSFVIFGIRWKSVDIDDVIVNVAGGVLGWVVARAFLALKPSAETSEREQSGPARLV